jgi:hypothetical protein
VGADAPVAFPYLSCMKHNEPDWSSVKDWSLGNTIIAKQLGCTPCQVGDKRKELFQPPRKGTRHKVHVPRSFAMPQMSDEELRGNLGQLAIKFHVQLDTLREERVRRGIIICPGGGRRPGMARPTYNVDWDKVDFNRRPQELADEIGCSVKLVYDMRAKRKLHKRGRIHSPEVLAREAAWKATDWSLSSPQIAKLMNCHINTVLNRRKKHAPHTVQPNQQPCHT